MLKALELIGFKSFADKTRFEFPAGITVVVGPNGSGKSNIVDAIKWVLGEQSAKSLRGKEMSDVIFKGSSGANARRPANSATATLILENADRQLSYDADEVHISRRVYRSGESEYLINGEVCRLKDIKELFRGTGVGTDAYSLIEQGKVERMLQANPKDRRAIFEEAAGISRFKAKKIEAQRRLARVDANLIRLADIVEEVGRSYRSVKNQASKAARYKDYADRLKWLRTYVGQQDWFEFKDKTLAIQAELDQAKDRQSRLTVEMEQLAQATAKIEDQFEQVSQDYQQQQELASQVREKFTQTESQLEISRSRLGDIQARQADLEEQWQRASRRTEELTQRIETAEKEATNAHKDHSQSQQRLSELESQLAEHDQKISELQSSLQATRADHVQAVDKNNHLGRQLTAVDTQIENLQQAQARFETQIEELQHSQTSYRDELAQIKAEAERLQREAETIDSALAQARQQQRSLQAELGDNQKRLNELNKQHIAATQRAEVIEELERSLEGINAGAREILKAAKTQSVGPLATVRGLVADLVSVNVQHASIVDVALGDLAQYVIVEGTEVVELIANEKLKLNGRVGMIQLQNPPTMGADPTISLNGIEGVIGRTDRLVQVQPEFQNFIRQLLGGTWVVQSLTAALKIRKQQADDQPVRLVTLDGEIIEADGTVLAGPKSLALGLVSRRSELRALKREIERLEGEIQTQTDRVVRLTEANEQALEEVQARIDQNQELSSQLAEQKSREKSVNQNLQKNSKQLQSLQAEANQSLDRLREQTDQRSVHQAEWGECEQQIAEILTTIEDYDRQLKGYSEQRANLEQQASAARVNLAKSEQVLDGLKSSASQYRKELEEHQQICQDAEKRKRSDLQATDLIQQSIAAAVEELAGLKLGRDEASQKLSELNQSRIDIDHQRRESQRALSEKREQLRIDEDRIFQCQLRLEQLDMQKNQLTERLFDDYGVDVEALETPAVLEETASREDLDNEIAELRKKLNELGSVNMDALQELEELETRYLSMDTQYQDLVQAKESLEKIITRIDADSRKLFVETMNAIRINFQKLFRQTFGGGQADIILEEGVDPLEAGVEIVATPPGKSQFSNSLLSGGEKALTAVSLLMAIFQFRPSPFCVLDEVDAPFDEANIGRFIDVLKSFLGWTRFVIVTHSKKTMTAATTLYGITMQESGVSKRVSVRFEDVSDDGEISEEAVKRSEGDAA